MVSKENHFYKIIWFQIPSTLKSVINTVLYAVNHLQMKRTYLHIFKNIYVPVTICPNAHYLAEPYINIEQSNE